MTTVDILDAILYSDTITEQQNATYEPHELEAAISSDENVNLHKRIIDVCEKNPWLKGGLRAWNDDYKYCFTWGTLDDLKEYFKHGNWALRQGFCHRINREESLIFVQQVNGGDEYLAIKQTGEHFFPFESISFGLIIEKYDDLENEYESLMKRLTTASDDDLKNLNY